MVKGQIFIEPRQNEAGVWFKLGTGVCFKLGVANLLWVADIYTFFRAAVQGNEGSAEVLREAYDEWSKVCKTAWSNDKLVRDLDAKQRHRLHERLAEAAVGFYGCSPDVKTQMVSFFESYRQTDWDHSFAKLRKIIENSKSGFTCVARPSWYFDSTSSDARPNIIVEPFFSMKISRPVGDVVEFILHTVLTHGLHSSYKQAVTPESLRPHCCASWARAIVSDMILRLGNPENRDTVWKKFEEMGINFSEKCKGLIVDQLRRSKRFRKGQGLIHGVQWEYNKEAFKSARHQWTEKWADLLAEKYGRSKQGSARYERGGGVNKSSRPMMVPDTAVGDVFMWILFDTHYEPWMMGIHHLREEPHSRFVRTLGEYCKARWFDDVRKELEEYSRSLLIPGNDQSQENATKDFVEKIGSLGLSFSLPAIYAIRTHLQGSSSRRPGMRLSTDLTLIKEFTSHKFKVDPGKVSKHNAKYIKAALGKAADDEACRFCGTCASKPDDNCFFSGAGRLAHLEIAIDNGFKSGMFFQKTPASTIEDCGEIARRPTVFRQHERTPLPALKLLRTTNGREISEIEALL